MTDHVDYAAEYLRGFPEKEHMPEPDFPWIGAMVGMFQHLASRGFVMGPRIHWPEDRSC